MKKPLALLPFVLSSAAFGQTPARPNVPIKMSWSWVDHSASKSVFHQGSLVVSFGCGPVEAGWDRSPEGDPDKSDTKWTNDQFEKCGDAGLLAEFVHVYNYSKEIGVNYDMTDELCRDWRELPQGDTCALEHNNWNGHPYSYVISQRPNLTSIGWFIVLDQHVAISLTLSAPTSRYSPEDWKAFTNSLVIDLRTY